MRVLWISAIVVVLDQLSKVAVLNLMYRQQSIEVLGDWLRLTFTENPGMAFGLSFGPKGTITILALIATCLVAYYIVQVRTGYTPYVASLAMIFGGAIGNIIDRIFYGEILGYGSFFTGKVVDFIHVNVWQGFVPEIIPVLGGSYVELFPIWNVADMAIVVGVVGVLFFHHTFHEQMERRLAADRAPASDAALDASGVATSNGASASSPSPHEPESEDAVESVADDLTDGAGRSSDRT